MSIDDDGVQLISDALKLRCRRCDGMHLTVRNEEPIEGIPIPILSYVCRDCGLDSKELNNLQKRVKAMLDDVRATGHVPSIEERLQNLIKSLDKICSACLAATSAETHELLHRGRVCSTKESK